MSSKLKAQHEKFCQEYTKCGIGRQAAINAGYAESCAHITASKLLTNHNIQMRIEELNKKVENTNIATAQEIQEILTKMARGQMSEECVAVELVGVGFSKACIVKKEITPKDQQKAAETLAKIKRLFDDAPQSPVTIVINRDYE